MTNDTYNHPFPYNLLHDLGAEMPSEIADDFFGSLMYVLRSVTTARDSRIVLMRYKDNKTLEEIAEAFKISKQRASVLLTSIMNKITGDYMGMLTKGIKKYYDDLFADRIAELTHVLRDSESEYLKINYYSEGYDKGYENALANTNGDKVSKDTLEGIRIKTLQLSNRTRNALTRNGLETLGDVVQLGDSITSLRSFGKACFFEIAKILQGYGASVVHTFPTTCALFGWEE